MRNCNARPKEKIEKSISANTKPALLPPNKNAAAPSRAALDAGVVRHGRQPLAPT
jgi:hypothetical protein